MKPVPAPEKAKTHKGVFAVGAVLPGFLLTYGGWRTCIQDPIE